MELIHTFASPPKSDDDDDALPLIEKLAVQDQLAHAMKWRKIALQIMQVGLFIGLNYFTGNNLYSDLIWLWGQWWYLVATNWVLWQRQDLITCFDVADFIFWQFVIWGMVVCLS